MSRTSPPAKTDRCCSGSTPPGEWIVSHPLISGHPSVISDASDIVMLL
uniref:Phb3 n=1 Tax=Arundo donax TaxID=35708 RepID=A0A0A9FA84_ARUDO